MEIGELFAISKFGMDFEKNRAKAASLNIANANTVQVSGYNQFKPVSVVADSPFVQMMNAAEMDSLPNISVIERSDAPKLVHQPNHPAADANGYIRYPNVNLAEEMSSLTSASRAYEANVKILNAINNMASKALEIGSGR